MNVTQQLDGGVRFLDFRIQYTEPPKNSATQTDADWYCLHFVQSQNTVLTYLQQVRAWLVAHPTEVVVMWMSKHGSECNNAQFADVPMEVLHVVQVRAWTFLQQSRLTIR